MAKVVIVSLRFNPGHFSHLVATCELCIAAGFEPILYVHPEFGPMDTSDRFKKIYSLPELKGLGNVRSAVFWFPGLKNIAAIVLLKFLYRNRIIYIYHEPWDSVLSYLASGFGILKVIKVFGVSLISLLTVALVDAVILPSTKAADIYRKKYRWLNSNFARVPLIFDDEASAKDLESAKTLISYIGTIAEDHAFDKFILFIDAAIQDDWFPEYSYAIATRSVIPESLLQKLRPLVALGRLRIAQGKPLSTDEINRFYRDSLIVWNAYNRSMQSGVLPKAYMFGAAVIASCLGEAEFVEDRVTGRIVQSNDDIKEIKQAIEEIVARRQGYAKACRAKFESTFYYKASAEKFVSLITS